VFQSFNLVPTLTTEENISLPAHIAGDEVDQAWFDQLVSQLGSPTASLTARPSCRAASSNGSPARGR
jgi:ABC-type lipoprotein export system ATPase subunit